MNRRWRFRWKFVEYWLRPWSPQRSLAANRSPARVPEPGTLSHSEGNTMRRFKAASLFALTMGLALPAFAAGIPVKLYKNPNCGCCNVYADYLKGNGFDVEAINTTDMASIKTKYSVPAAVEGCHTAIAGG